MLYGGATYGGATYGGTVVTFITIVFNLTVVNIAGVAMQNATVRLWDKDNNLVVNESTDLNGEIVGQILYDDVMPHTMRIMKAGHTTYIVKFTKSNAIEWLIGLIHSNIDVDQEAMS